MALGDKLPVVMGREKAAPDGVATLGADGILTEAQRPSLGQIRGGSNPNLLLNWDFRNPVNRNGQAEYAGTTYGIERWKSTNGNLVVTVDNGYVTLSTNSANTEVSGGRGYWRQFFDRPLRGAFTFTVLVRGTALLYLNTADEDGNYASGAEEVQLSPETWQIIQFHFNTDNLTGKEAAQVYLRVSANAFCDVLASKLEPSDHQTLTRQNSDGEWEIIDPPDYDLQYALCSQYSPITGEWIGSQHSNPNLLDNWYFVGGGSQQGGGQFPINQRGQTKYTGPGYTIDRWKLSGTTRLELLDNCIRFTATAINNGKLLGKIIENPEFYAGKIVTLSALVRGNVNAVIGAWDATLSHTSYGSAAGGISDSPTLLTHTFTFPNDIPNGLLFYVGIENNRSIDVDTAYVDAFAAKLELGPVQTLAHKEGDTWVLNDPPPNYQQELAKCQRYQVQTNRDVSSVGYGYAVTATMALISFNLPPMRIAPTIAFKNLLLLGYAHGGTSGISVTSIDAIAGGNNFYVALVYCAGGLTPGDPLILQVRNKTGETGGFFRADANF